MLFLTFQAGDSRFALAAGRVLEVVPRVRLQPCPDAPACVAGFLDYRGTCVPVVDLCRLVHGAPAAELLSTRIVVTQYRAVDGRQRSVGLLAEGVTSTLGLETDDFSQVGLASRALPGLGKLAVAAAQFVQRLELERLLPADWERRLFPPLGSGGPAAATAKPDCGEVRSRHDTPQVAFL
jgi:chemotaxis-related protein WspB